MKEEYKKALVVGLGFRSGLSAANFMNDRGVDVTVSDMKSEDELKEIIDKLNPGITVIAGDQSPAVLDRGFDILVLSPGVPQKIPLVQEAFKRGVPVISEVELAFLNMKGSVIAITGTDGKSTTTCLTGHIFSELGFDSLVGGNIGIPLISLAEKTGEDTVTVVELSSFQLETVDTFKPDVSAILNVTPDHMDRYDGMNDYFGAKKKIFMNHGDSEYFIYNRDSKMLRDSEFEFPGNSQYFSVDDENAHSFYRGGIVYIKRAGELLAVVQGSKLSILGIHNIQNVMASLLMVTALLYKLGVDPDFNKIAQACYSFKGLEHRMEYVGDYEERSFVNDSKATTIGAVEMAVKSIRDMGVVILGGKTKGDDYTRLREVFQGKARALVLIGDSSEEFGEIFSDLNCVRAGSMDDAVSKAMKLSEKGDMILLSPACASFDMYSSFNERGEVFKKAYEKLIRGELSWT